MSGDKRTVYTVAGNCTSISPAKQCKLQNVSIVLHFNLEADRHRASVRAVIANMRLL